MKAAIPGPSEVAYSYIRFSSPEQAKGDSLRRQTEAAADWCQRNEVTLDASTTLHDLGKSAFKGAHRSNPDRNALAAFLKLVEAGKVPRGSYLVIENLDRLSREHIQPALLLVLNLLQAGIRIVQLKPAEMIFDSRSDTLPVMMMIVELSRGHSESAMKSERVGARWEEKRKAARDKQKQPPRRKDGRVTESMTDRLPNWIEERDGRLVLIPERADVVRLIFHLAAAGYGINSIVKKLTADRVPPLGRSGKWVRSYVALLLTERQAVGELQPRRRDGTPHGDPIPGYYPAAITNDEWRAARVGADQRRKKRGRVGSHVNVFAGMVKNARDGDSYFAVTSHGRNGNRRNLVNGNGHEGRSKWWSFPLDTFEKGIFSKLREISPAEVLGTDDAPAGVVLLQGELAVVESELADANAFMEARGFSVSIGLRVEALEERKRDLGKRLVEAEYRAAHPLAGSWADAHSLLDTLASAPDPADARVRLRSALRRLVKGVWLLVVARGADRLAAVQIHFTGGTARRDYLILHRPAKANARARTEGGVWVATWPLDRNQAKAGEMVPTGSEELDLRRRADVLALEAELLERDLDDLKSKMRRVAVGPVR
jgi:DNA invertase Pin-like site-specific DNA recombinase